MEHDFVPVIVCAEWSLGEKENELIFFFISAKEQGLRTNEVLPTSSPLEYILIISLLQTIEVFDNLI